MVAILWIVKQPFAISCSGKGHLRHSHNIFKWKQANKWRPATVMQVLKTKLLWATSAHHNQKGWRTQNGCHKSQLSHWEAFVQQAAWKKPPGPEAPGKVDAPVNLWWTSNAPVGRHLDNSSDTHVTCGCQLALMHRAKWNKHQRSGVRKDKAKWTNHKSRECWYYWTSDTIVFF